MNPKTIGIGALFIAGVTAVVFGVSRFGPSLSSNRNATNQSSSVNTSTNPSNGQQPTQNDTTTGASTASEPRVKYPAPPPPQTAWNKFFRAESTALQNFQGTESQATARCTALPTEHRYDKIEQGKCFADIAEAYSDPLICDRLKIESRPLLLQTDSGALSSCLVGAQFFMEPYDCQVHATRQSRDWCYYAAASWNRLAGKPVDCGPIENVRTRTLCQTKTGSFTDALANALESAGPILNAFCLRLKEPAIFDQLPNNQLRDFMKDFYNLPSLPLVCDMTKADVQVTRQDLLTDSDGDGVVKFMEDIWGSSDKKKDTDGDGFDDYAEIINGFDPTGPGKYEY